MVCYPRIADQLEMFRTQVLVLKVQSLPTTPDQQRMLHMNSLYLYDAVESGGGHVTYLFFDGSPALAKRRQCPARSSSRVPLETAHPSARRHKGRFRLAQEQSLQQNAPPKGVR
jgi:hypothetical protein